MKLLSEEQIFTKKEIILHNIDNGAIFLYPTDTVYGLGCDATDCLAVKKLKELKETNKPISIIAPSKEWIYENCMVNEKAKEWVEKLPGAYTLILPLKNKDAICEEVTNGTGTIGVRLINHYIQTFVRELNRPIVSTSANRTGKEIMTNIDRLDDKLKPHLDMILYEGEKPNKTSKIIDLTHDEKIILRE